MKGWKTYACVVAGCGAVVAEYFGVITRDMRETALAVLGFGGLAALRSAIKVIATSATGIHFPANGGCKKQPLGNSCQKPPTWK